MTKNPDPKTTQTLSLDAYWMPFTANRQFKQAPRMLAKAEGMHFWTPEGRKILDGIAGLWCVNAGHARPKIVQAIQQQAAEMDFAPPFNMGHPKAFELAQRLVEIAPAGLNKVFYTNSGSESVETALKMAIAYHRARGEGSRTRLIGRERGYHGVNFGGISVGGIVANRKMFGTLLAGVDHIRHTHDLARNAFSRGVPEHGAELADDLERLVALHDASTIAAVIVEPVAGNMNLVMPRAGFLEGLRELCTRHGSVLIFDEVMTGFRVHPRGVQGMTGITPDLTTLGKVIGGGMPVGAFGGRRDIMEKIAPLGPVYQAGTLSGNPVAVAAGIATLAATDAPGFYDALAAKTRSFTEGLAAAAKRANVEFCAQSVGGMFGLYFAPRVPDSYDTVMACDKARFNRFFHAMLEAGVYLAPSAYEAGFVSAAHGDADIRDTIAAAERIFATA